ncbi:alanine racemase [Cryobacterium sp. Sr8]|uniref:Alanine racemase n=1 Tax=Cryobacterium psychrotolerans TaxID=386301 RepID=A0A1G9AMG4_9MICO|nr:MULTISPECIES: alanine racemase [Cryobacterium]TFD42772.1 alanine racemase [Cryobacterium sp. TMT1-2-1]TFD75078.1 alanine racemase [Cryobacterium sp. Sr8]TFD89626.1 alanine racemase [Cryobacterium psychrotolerans]SDK27715.1 alanine racemase [Cryobacterium psychrotolerans]
MTGYREAVVDLDAISANVAHLRALTGTAHTMAVVKANAYGHGAVPVARAALAGGADWLGVADIAEALELREAGIGAPVLAWLHDPDTDWSAAIAADVDLGLSSAVQLQQVADASATLDCTASVQIKLETGLSRNGVQESEWAPVLALAAELERSGRVRVRGIFSHLSNASPAEDTEAIARFDRGLALAAAVGLTPELTHLAASAAALRLPAARYSMVRLGISIYGLSPFDDASSADLGLVPAMTLRGRVAAVRHVPAGTGVSYDYTWRAPVDSSLALVPLGYADGVPRQASGRAQVSIGGVLHPVVGRIAMDQFVVSVGLEPVAVGDEVVLFGDPASGVPSADDWAHAAGTINYDIVTRIGRRVPRSYRAAE